MLSDPQERLIAEKLTDAFIDARPIVQLVVDELIKAEKVNIATLAFVIEILNRSMRRAEPKHWQDVSDVARDMLNKMDEVGGDLIPTFGPTH